MPSERCKEVKDRNWREHIRFWSVGRHKYDKHVEIITY